MSLESLINESIDNPPVDGDDPVTEDRVASPLAQARHESFVKMADTQNQDRSGSQFSIDTINASNAAATAKRLKAEALAARRAEGEALELQLMESDLDPETTFRTIKDVREAMQAGTSPEDLAIQELAAKNIQDVSLENQEDIAYRQALEDAEKYSTSRMLAELKGQLDKDFETTIPGVEFALEFLTSVIAFPKSGGTNVAGLIENVFGIEPSLVQNLTPGNLIIEAQKIANDFTPEQTAAAIKRAHTHINDKAGVLFDNGQDAVTMMNALEAAFGTRVQAEAARVAGTSAQVLDLVLTLGTLGTGKGAKVAVEAAEEASKLSRVSKGALDIDLGDAAPVSTPRRGSVDVDLGGPKSRPDVDLGTGPHTIANDLDIDFGPSKAQITPDLDLGPAQTRAVNAAARSGVPHTGNPAFSPAQLLNDVAPQRAGPILSDAIKDTTGKVADGLGTTRAQVAEDTITTVIAGGPIRRGATLIEPNISNTISDAGAELRNLMSDSKLYTADEIEDVTSNLSSKLDNLHSDEVTLYSKSEAIVDESIGRISMDYTIGAGGNRTFGTKAEATAFVNRLAPENIDDIRVFKFNSQKNQYLEYTGADDVRGEYLLRARYTDTKASGARSEDVLRSATAHPLTNHTDSTVGYIKRMAQGISRLDIRQAQAQKVFSEILKPLQALSSKADLDKVWTTLKNAEKNADDYTQGQLSRMLGGDQKNVAAYRSVRRFYQAVYEVRNQQYRDFLSKRGFLSHMHKDGTNNWVTPVKDNSGIVTVWWDEAGGIVSKQSLLDKGIELDIMRGFKPKRSPRGQGGVAETEYVAVRKGKSSLQPLPSQVLFNKKTYLGRHLDAKYVIEEVQDAVVNGTRGTVARVLAVANNPTDASREALKGTNRRWRRAIETTETDATYLAQEMNQMHDLQMLNNTKHRLDFEAMDVTRQHSLLSPMESLDRVRNTMSKNLVLNDWIDYNTNKWVQTYGHLFKEKGFQWGGKIQLKSELAADPESLRQLARARLVRERIQITTGIHDIQIAEKLQQALIGSAEWLTRATANSIKKSDAGLIRDMKINAVSGATTALTALGSVNVVSGAKALAHQSYIVANMVRQLVMQSTSAVMYAGVQHGSRYFATGSAAVDFAFLATAKGIKNLNPGEFTEIAKKYAKAKGISQKDAVKFFEDFDNSGTLGSVSSHQFLEHGLRASGSYRNHAGTYAGDAADGAIRSGLRTAKGAFDTVSRNMSHYGFEAGEKANRISAYLAVRNKHLVNNTIGEVDATDLGTEALQVAGNMGQFNKAAFQQGALGVPFQFMSYTTRMIQMMLPQSKWTSWVASDIYSGSEKAKIGLWQAAMFGTGGLGLGSLFMDDAVSNGIEIDPEVQNALEEGLVGLGLEALIEGMGGSEANINISGVMGPLSGLTGDVRALAGNTDRAATPLGKMLKVIVDLGTELPVGLADISGASSGATRNVFGIVKNVDNIWMNPVLGVGEKLEKQMRDIAIMIPMVNNALQARMMSATGDYTNKYGTPIAQVTAAEALSRGLIGVGPEAVADVYKLNAELRGKRQTLMAPTHRELGNSGKDLASWTYNALKEVNGGRMSKEDAIGRIEAGMATVMLAYEDQTDRDVVKKTMKKELVKLAGNRETLSDDLVKLLASDLELQQEMGWEKVRMHVGKLAESPARNHYLKNLDKIIANTEGSKLTFEPTL